MKLLHQIKIWAKKIFILSLLFVGLIIPSQIDRLGSEYFPDLESLSTQVLENSLMKIHVISNGFKMSGSGVIINIRNKINVLTNAHVCLGPSYIDVVFKKKKNIDLSFEVNSKELYYSNVVNLKQLQYNIDEDWCLMPLNLAYFHKPILTDKFIQDKMPMKAMTMTYNRQKSVSQYDMFTACSTDPFLALLDNGNTACDLEPILQQPKKLRITSNKKEEHKMMLGSHYIYKFAPIPGDSGSPVYNEKNQLVGLIVGQHKNDVKKDIIDWGYVTHFATLKNNIKNKIILGKKRNSI